MKPLKFDYRDPESLDEALDLLAEHGGDAKILAGGQSLMPMLAMRLAYPGLVVDINRIKALRRFQRVGDDWTLGALVRHATAEDSVGLMEDAPVIRKAMHWVGHRSIRNRGTIVGSLAHADPAAEMPAVMTALEATATACSASGRRTIPVADLFEMPMVSRLEEDEMLLEVAFAARPAAEGSAVVEVARRHGDFALAGVVALVALEEGGRIASASLVSFATGPRPVRLTRSEEALIGTEPGDATLAEAGKAAADAIEPADDLHATAEYRRSVTDVLVRRALAAAIDESRGKLAAEGAK